MGDNGGCTKCGSNPLAADVVGISPFIGGGCGRGRGLGE